MPRLCAGNRETHRMPGAGTPGGPSGPSSVGCFKEKLRMRQRVKKAFTLVEILIVVVILGILAAIVVPHFTNASTEAQAGNCATQLQTIRSQIELFRVRNNGNYPDLLGSGWTPLVGSDYMRAAPVNPRTNSST